MSWRNITSDIEFDEYGDFEFVNNDLSVLTEPVEILRQNIIDRIITSFGDYDLYPAYGLDLKSEIGKPVNSKLEDRVRSRIVQVLTADQFLTPHEINTYVFSELDKLFIKLEIPTARYLASDDTLSITCVLDTITGSIYAS